MRAKDDKALCESIGRFVVIFSELEFVIHWTITAIMQPSNGEDALYGAIDFNAKCTLLERLLETVPPGKTADQKTRQAFFSNCRRLAEIRNQIAHGTWTDQGLKHTSRNSLKPVLHFQAPNEFEKRIKELDQLWVEGLELYFLGPSST